MKYTFLLILTLILPIKQYSQIKLNKASIILNQGALDGRSYITNLKKDSVEMMVYSKGLKQSQKLSIPVSKINAIKINYGRNHAKGALTGLLVGSTVGLIFGALFSSSGSSSSSIPILTPPKRNFGLIKSNVGGGVFFGGLIGSLLGLATGAKKKKMFVLNSDPEIYKNNLPQMTELLIKTK